MLRGRRCQRRGGRSWKRWAPQIVRHANAAGAPRGSSCGEGLLDRGLVLVVGVCASGSAELERVQRPTMLWFHRHPATLASVLLVLDGGHLRAIPLYVQEAGAGDGAMDAGRRLPAATIRRILDLVVTAALAQLGAPWDHGHRPVGRGHMLGTRERVVAGRRVADGVTAVVRAAFAGRRPAGGLVRANELAVNVHVEMPHRDVSAANLHRCLPRKQHQMHRLG